ncbi:hypothetical protein GCM10023196_035830 [Actinoallomurus vinaceus]|uniref:REase associating with pPIWI RE domain-containing protein n=1 Tax=Actinoallomurus vinaceus TaxID=1080074 RepID=A0ABP8UAW7_9ACTN
MTHTATRATGQHERQASAAEQITDLLTQLHTEVRTDEKVLRYRRVNRGRRDAVVPDFVIHRTRRPGLLTQLGTVQAAASTVPVEVFHWVPDENDPCQRAADEDAPRVCGHGRWVHVRTEQRPVTGVITTGAALPGGSPGWDADGALSPMAGGGKPEAAEPIADAWHTGDEIRDELAALGRELHAEGWRAPDTLITIALADEDTGRRIAARLRGLVARARIAAGYDAPIVPLRDVYCPLCGGELRVRADASSAVWCAGMLPIQGPAAEGESWPIGWARCAAKWPRGSWVKLLEEATPNEPVEPDDDRSRAANRSNPSALVYDEHWEVPVVLDGLVDVPQS